MGAIGERKRDGECEKERERERTRAIVRRSREKALKSLSAYVRIYIFFLRWKTYLIHLCKHEYVLNFSEEYPRKVKREQKLWQIEVKMSERRGRWREKKKKLTQLATGTPTFVISNPSYLFGSWFVRTLLRTHCCWQFLAGILLPCRKFPRSKA